MQPLHQKSPLFEYGVPLLLTVGIFVLDLSAPAGIDLWLLYAVPFTLIAVSSLGQVPRYLMGLVALLALIGPLASSAGSLPLSSWLNRLLGIGIMGAVAALVAGRRSSPASTNASPGLSSQAFTTARAERHQPEAGEVSDAEARARAEAAVVGAVAGQRRAEAELHQDKLRFEGIVHSAMDAIITVDEAHKIVLFNQAAEKMFQWGAEEVVGRPLDRLLPERFRSTHDEHIREFGRSGITTRQKARWAW